MGKSHFFFLRVMTLALLNTSRLIKSLHSPETARQTPRSKGGNEENTYEYRLETFVFSLLQELYLY